jgi:exopolysaccharide biosynthesis operon protein EpsL
MLASPPAAALFGDRVEVFAAENVTYDSNVFRISSKLDPNLTIGSSDRSDTISTTQVGATLDVPYSLQRFQAGYTWYGNRYQRFSVLDFNGHTARAAWLWSVTPELTGDLGYTDTEGLANFANIQGTTPDILRTRQAFANAVWFPSGHWRIHGGTAVVKQTHGDAVQSVNDIETATGVAGVSYVTPQDDRLGVEARVERGRSPHDDLDTAATPFFFSSEYRQHSVGAVGHWIATGHSVIDARADWVQRDYEVGSQRDFKGPTFRVSHTWTPTGKLTVITAAQRDVGPVQDVQTSSFVLVKGVSVRPAWAFTDKISITGDAEYNIWDYRGDLLTGQSWTHRVRTLGVGLSYRPTRKILLQAGLSHEERTSTLAFSDYKDDIASVSARIGF